MVIALNLVWNYCQVMCCRRRECIYMKYYKINDHSGHVICIIIKFENYQKALWNVKWRGLNFNLGFTRVETNNSAETTINGITLCAWNKNTRRTAVRREPRGWLARSHLQSDTSKVSLVKNVNVPVFCLHLTRYRNSRRADWQLKKVHVL